MTGEDLLSEREDVFLVGGWQEVIEEEGEDGEQLDTSEKASGLRELTAASQSLSSFLRSLSRFF